jgi:DNA modification methylase
VYKIETGDCRELLKRVKMGYVDCVITDPPFNGYGLQGVEYCKRFLQVYDLMKHLTNRMAISAMVNRHKELMAGMEMTDKFKIENAFFDVRDHDVWFMTKNQLHDASDAPKWSKTIVPESIHENARDVAKMAIVVEAMTNEGETVLDPFCGSASIGVACVLLNRNYIGFELLPERSADAETRMRYAQFYMDNIKDK